MSNATPRRSLLAAKRIANLRRKAAYWGLCFTALEDNCSVAMAAYNSAPSVSLKYSLDGATWDDFTVGSTIVPLSSGQRCYVKAGPNGNIGFCNPGNFNAYNYFVTFGQIEASGNIMSLLSDDEGVTFGRGNVFGYLFKGCSITTPPSLPSDVLMDGVYFHIFHECQMLSQCPELPSKSLVGNCYNGMFYRCNSITLPCSLAHVESISGNAACNEMFRECANLIAAPELPSVFSGDRVYQYLCRQAPKVSSIRVHFTEWPTGASATNGWMDRVNNVSAGTFYCPAALGTQETITRDISHCPANWQVVNI